MLNIPLFDSHIKTGLKRPDPIAVDLLLKNVRKGVPVD